MKNLTKKELQISRRASLSSRLTAYSALAGAALVCMPAAQGMIVPPQTCPVSGSPAPICEGIVQGHQVQSPKVRLPRPDGIRVMSTSTCTPTPTSSTGE